MKCIVLTVCIVNLVACSSVDKSKYIRFLEKLTYNSSEWREQDFGTKLSIADKLLLKKYSPNLWVKSKSCGPMDFYKQYVPLIKIVKDNKLIPGSRENLKKYERDFSVKIKLDQENICIEDQIPPLYAYSWNENMNLADGRVVPIKVLRYGFTFYKSGLPIKQSTFQSLGAVLGDSSHWHYLDLHGGIFYLLDRNNNIFALVLAQHNHFRSYIVGVDISIEEAKTICFSERSNEPYLCSSQGEQLEPVAPNFQNIKWVITGEDRPALGAWDRVPGVEDRRRVNYHLEFLSSHDPLITSWVELGPNIKIWGIYSTFYRNAPPGMAIFNTPKLKELWKTAQYFYFDPNNDLIFDQHFKNSNDFIDIDIKTVFDHNSKRFTSAVSPILSDLARDLSSAK